MTYITTDRLVGLIKLAYGANTPLLLISEAGIGKSTIFAAAAAALGLNLIVIDLSVMEPTDLLGLPRIVNGKTTYAPPGFLPTSGRGLLLFEELNRASSFTRTPALELLTRRAIQGYSLPPGWLPVAAANPEGAGYAVDTLDQAFLSRFIVVGVRASTSGWLSWARTNRLHPAIISYVEAVPDFFERNPRVSPRSLEQASKLLSAAQDGSFDPTITAVALGGVLGDPMAVAVLRFSADTVKPPEPKEILNRYRQLQPDIRRMAKAGRLDVLRATLAKVEQYFDSATWAAVKADPNQSRNLDLFLGDVPADLRLEFYRSIAAKELIPEIES